MAEQGRRSRESERSKPAGSESRREQRAPAATGRRPRTLSRHSNAPGDTGVQQWPKRCARCTPSSTRRPLRRRVYAGGGPPRACAGGALARRRGGRVRRGRGRVLAWCGGGRTRRRDRALGRARRAGPRRARRPAGLPRCAGAFVGARRSPSARRRKPESEKSDRARPPRVRTPCDAALRSSACRSRDDPTSRAVLASCAHFTTAPHPSESAPWRS